MRSLFGRRLKPSEKRSLQILAGAAALFIILDFVVLPVMDNAERLRAALPLREKTLIKYQSRVALAGTQQLDKESLQSRVTENEKGLLDSRTSALASAELQDLIKRLMAGQGIEMQGATFLPPRNLAHGYATVPLSFSFSSTLDQFVNLLIAARACGKTLAVEQISVTAVPPRQEKPRKVVNVTLVVHGLMAAEAPVRAPATAPKG